MSSTCVSCNKKISRANDGFDCGMCHGMFHLKCEGINLLAEEYQRMSPAERRKTLCKSCHSRRNRRLDDLGTPKAPTVTMAPGALIGAETMGSLSGKTDALNARLDGLDTAIAGLSTIQALLKTTESLCAQLRTEVEEMRRENTALKERDDALEEREANMAPTEPPCDVRAVEIHGLMNLKVHEFFIFFPWLF
ncbi:hypothetical protein DMENIID0001_083800 [Sergentomyia squamirostris]